MTGDALETLARLDPRVPGWTHDQAADRACPLCDRLRPAVLRRPDGLPLAHCPACHLWFVARVISQDELERFYSDYWGTFRPAPGTPASVRRFREAAQAGAEADIRLQRLDALLGGLGGRRILDVGCGLGAFIAAARARGADVIGQELSGAACEFVRGKIGASALHEPLESVERAVGAVDAVVMIDVLEHLARPKEALASAWRMLSPGGLLLLWTPNGGGAGSSLETARAWIGFRVDLDHLQYFSVATIARLCHGGGWRIEHLETLGFPDLDGIGGAPATVGRRIRLAAANLGSRIPGARRLVSAVRAARPGWRNPRLGTYHLFSILRKAREDARAGGASA